MSTRRPYRPQLGLCVGETTLFVGDGQLLIRGDVATVERYLAAIEVARPGPASIADALEAAATNLSPSRAAIYRRLTAALRKPGFRKGRS